MTQRMHSRVACSLTLWIASTCSKTLGKSYAAGTASAPKPAKKVDTEESQIPEKEDKGNELIYDPFSLPYNQSPQENVFGKQFSTFDSPRDHPKRNQSDDVQRNREAVPEAGRTKTIHTSEERQNQGTIPMPTFAPRPLTMSSFVPVDIPQSSMFGQQRRQIPELQFDKFPLHHHLGIGR